ncbi:hypothetical protein WJX72_008807 [[Myrmecia] bisecta]|uniref:Glycosyl transferase family 1 domain-containing protein n=1 Tax=[Myrmecia] bisecta TaxID=41462 RepID=A0AAW1QFV8_9CHLO
MVQLSTIQRSSSKSLSATFTPLRLFVLVNVGILVIFYGVMSAFHLRISQMEDTKSSGRPSGELRLGMPRSLVATDDTGCTKPPVPAAAAPVSYATKWDGPLDLDEQTYRLAAQINQTYWDAPGEKTWWNKPGFHLSYMEPDPPYPFQRIKSEDGKDTGIVALIAPFYDTNYYKAESARALFWRLKKAGHIMIGISSYQEFPGPIMNPFDDRHTTPADDEVWAAMDGWLHCFREEDKVRWMPPNVPRINLSESDFHNPERRDDGGSLIPWGVPKEVDIVYSNQGGEWNDFARNWTLAKEVMHALVNELDLKIMIMGREIDPVKDADIQALIDRGSVIRQPKMPWNQFLKTIEKARTLMTPNVHDASPRVLVEALSLNMTVLINKHIVGGWKYATEATGEEFGTAAEAVEAMRRLRAPERQAKLRPREWYRETWGYYRSSVYLQAFMEIVVGKERLAKAKQLILSHNVN